MTVERIHRVQDEHVSFVSFRVTPDEIRKGDVIDDGLAWVPVTGRPYRDFGRVLHVPVGERRELAFLDGDEVEVRRSKGSA